MKKLLLLLSFYALIHLGAVAQLQEEINNFIGYNSDKIIQLVDAIPEDKLSWMPDEGVRSFSEVFAHIAAANYMFMSSLGGTIPTGVNPQTLEKDLKTRVDIKLALQTSFGLLAKSINNVADEDLAVNVTMPWGTEMSRIGVLLLAQGHSNEHLGQLIAYARTNKITPPWSGGE
ncbi:MAG: DinB family protein [Bacteroidetes bacterium]|nr:DinB family protein [Bacteroidota bacterium]MDA1121146.1 DinB family protein [Bacteroidota bacterium]